MSQDTHFEQLKSKYQSVLELIKSTGVRLSHLHVQDNKLFMQGEAPSDHIKNKVWDEIKRVDPTYSDLTCDLTINPALAPQTPQASQQAAQQTGASAAGGMQTYTVQPGDSLSKISKQFYGNANQYMKIFEANRNVLSDPNKIQPGQQLNIPS